MKETIETGARRSTSLKAEPDLLEQYGCGPIRFTGGDALYDRHLMFDEVIDPATTGA